MFISFTHRISLFFPAESENGVRLFLCDATERSFSWGWCLPFVQECVWMGKPTQRAGDVLVYRTKLKCNSARLAGLTVKCLSGFHLLGWQESSLQSSRFRQAATGPGYQMVSGHLHIVELMFGKMQILQLFTHLYMLIKSAFSLDRPPPHPLTTSTKLFTLYSKVLWKNLHSLMSGGCWSGCIFNKGCQEVGCGCGRGLLFKRNIKQSGDWQLTQRHYQWFWYFSSSAAVHERCKSAHGSQSCSSVWTLKTLFSATLISVG